MSATRHSLTLSRHRNPLFQGKLHDQEDDFFPKFKLENGIPDIPVKPKLLWFVDTDPASADNNIHKYQYSSVEMLEEQAGFSNQILTDYNMGMHVNLVDRDVYNLNGGQLQNDSSPEKMESAAEQYAKMPEKLKFVLSDKDQYDPYESMKKMRMSKKIIIPSKFTAHDKINRYGGKIEDPFNLNVLNAHEADDRVFTAKVH